MFTCDSFGLDAAACERYVVVKSHKRLVGEMINTGAPRRTSKTTEEILAALNKALQTHPECVGMTVRKLTRLDNSHGLANWDAEFTTEHGTTISAECKRVFISAKQGIQKHFDLAGGG